MNKTNQEVFLDDILNIQNYNNINSTQNSHFNEYLGLNLYDERRTNYSKNISKDSNNYSIFDNSNQTNKSNKSKNSFSFACNSIKSTFRNENNEIYNHDYKREYSILNFDINNNERNYLFDDYTINDENIDLNKDNYDNESLSLLSNSDNDFVFFY